MNILKSCDNRETLVELENPYELFTSTIVLDCISGYFWSSSTKMRVKFLIARPKISFELFFLMPSVRLSG